MTMCAKKRASPRKSWCLAGAPLHPSPLGAEEKELIADSFSICYDWHVQDIDLKRYMTMSEAKTTESAVQAIANPLCQYFEGQYERDTVITVVADTAAIPLNMVAPIASRPGFLMGAAIWFLDYLEASCGAPDKFLAILPQEPDPELEDIMPYAEDLKHPHAIISRMTTVLAGRRKRHHRAFHTLLKLIGHDTAAWLRELFESAMWDYMKRALESYERLQNDSWGPLGPEIQLDKPLNILEIARDFGDPEFRFLHLAPELVCRPMAVIQEQFHTRRVSELLSSYSTDEPYALCMAYLLLEQEKDVLANLNALTAIVMTCAIRHLPWAREMSGAGARLFEHGAPDYRLRYTCSEPSGSAGDKDEPGQLLSESQLFCIATGVVPPRDHRPSSELIGWFMRQGVSEQRSRELAWGAMYAFHASMAADGAEDIDWDVGEAVDVCWPKDDQKSVGRDTSTDQDRQASTAQVGSLTRKLKDMRSAWHDAKQAAGQMKEQLMDMEQQWKADQAELAQLRETLYQLRAGEDGADDADDTQIEFPWQVHRRVVVFGGHDSWCKAIKPLLPGVRFCDRDTMPVINTIRGADMVWLQVNAMSHNYYYRVIDICRKDNVPIRYFGSGSAKRCAVQLVKEELAAQDRERG